MVIQSPQLFNKSVTVINAENSSNITKPKSGSGTIFDSKAKESDSEKINWKNVAIVSGFAVLGCITGYSIFKNFRNAKLLKETTAKLAQTTAELNRTKATLAEAENVLMEVSSVLSSEKPSMLQKFKNAFSQIPFKEIYQRTHIGYSNSGGVDFRWN